MFARKNAPEKVDFNTWMGRLKAAGFTTVDRGNGEVLVSKDGCGSVIGKSPSGEPKFVTLPGVLFGEHLGRLLDRGFQKFWQVGERTIPAAAEQLNTLHGFEQQLRAVMHLTGLYNQNLGTVSSRYVYDRVEGREGPRVHKSFE
jgi:hypothetical protein